MVDKLLRITRIVLVVLLLLMVSTPTLALAESEIPLESDNHVFNLAAFPLKTTRETLRYMMDNLPVLEVKTNEVEEPWTHSTLVADIYVLPVLENQVFRYKDTDLLFDIGEDNFSLACQLDSKEEVTQVSVWCTLDEKYLAPMEVKKLFFSLYEALGLEGEPNVKGSIADKNYYAFETIDGVDIGLSLSELSFSITIS